MTEAKAPSSNRTLVLRLAMLIVGIGVVAWLVYRAGAASVWATLVSAGVWLPIIIVLETAFPITDALAVRGLLGDEAGRVPLSGWIRSAALAYAFMILLPAGRAAGEVARAAILSKYVPSGDAGLATTRLFAAYLFANSAMSLLAAAVTAAVVGPTETVTLLSLANAAVTGLFASTMFVLSRSARLRGWLRARFPKLASGPMFAPSEPTPFPWRGTFICFLGRLAQSLQYGVVLVAVGSAFSLGRGIVTLGIHLCGATVGDMVPNQVGVNEGAYTAFAGAVGIADAPERAVSIALVIRVAQLGLAAFCVAVAALVARGDDKTGTATAAPGSA